MTPICLTTLIHPSCHTINPGIKGLLGKYLPTPQWQLPITLLHYVAFFPLLCQLFLTYDYCSSPILQIPKNTPVSRKFGFHPTALKRAFGVVLPKPNKPDYTSPAAYRIIVLLETVSKILERIMTYRLHAFASASGLIHPHQCGSIKGLSTADAATTLIHEVRLLQRAGLKVSSLFLDVKGGFDHVVPSTLADTLTSKNTPPYMVQWVLSFLTDRSCTLLFPGSPKQSLPVAVGVPQGSPISPLLFCIYVAPLHIDPKPGITISYVDDFAFTVASHNYQQNALLLEEAFKTASSTGNPRNIHFSLPKTELIHWQTPADRSPPPQSTVTLNQTIFHPKPEIRWLGLQLTQRLTTFNHFAKRCASANASFALIRGFASAGKGLTPLNCRRLAVMAILPMLTYGASVLVPSARALKRLETVWHSVLRWVTNCFRSTPLIILQAEASFPPLSLYIPSLRLRYAARIQAASPTHNPVTARTPPTFHTIHPYRAISHRHLLGGKPNPPVNWNSNRKGVARLPIDELCNALLTNSPTFAQNPTTINPTLGLSIKKDTLQLWKSNPLPHYYTFPISTRPHLHLALDRFIAGRICQMRAHKSYLAGHTSWMNPLADTTCPRCEEEDEDFTHAIINCPARASARDNHIPTAQNLHSLWSNPTTMAGLANYIRSTKTGFPPQNGIPVSPPYHLSSDSDLTSISSDSESTLL